MGKGSGNGRSDRNMTYKVIGKAVSVVVSVAVIFFIGIAIAANINHTTFTVEWESMVAWFSTWAK